MNAASATSPEHPILRARARGEVSGDTAFEQLYALYARTVSGWLIMRADRADAEDLAQDVWTIFYYRWRRWQFLPEMEAPEARPVLSFLYRTAHFVLRGHRRRHALQHESLDEAEVSGQTAVPDGLLEKAEWNRCLRLAREICPPEELDVLLAKLAGVPAREIARTLEVTEAMVDHRYRNSIARLQDRLETGRSAAPKGSV